MTPKLTLCIALWVSAGVVACGSYEAIQRRELPPPEPRRHAAQHPRLAQTQLGAAAHFATCTPPHCPRPTTKTLAADDRVSQAEGSDGPHPVIAASALIATPDSPASVPPPPPVSTESAPTQPDPPPPLRVVVLFPSGSAALDRQAIDAIDLAASHLDGVTRTTISGRTDSIGPPNLNLRLARARAESVRRYLDQRHPRLAAAVDLDGRGACCYVAANDSAAGRANNRRVELVFERSGEDL